VASDPADAEKAEPRSRFVRRDRESRSRF